MNALIRTKLAPLTHDLNNCINFNKSKSLKYKCKSVFFDIPYPEFGLTKKARYNSVATGFLYAVKTFYFLAVFFALGFAAGFSSVAVSSAFGSSS